MNVDSLASRRFATAIAAVVVAVFGAYFVVAALVPKLFGRWPLYGAAALVGAAALAYAVNFLARAAVVETPVSWRAANAAAAAVCVVLDAQAVALATGTVSAGVTADSPTVALVHLLLWAGLVSTVVLLAAGFRAAGDGDLPDPDSLE